MNKSPLRWIGIGAMALVLPLAAAAQQAFTRGAVNLRAGPSADYPLVAQLAPGQPLEVVGCTSGYGWCDVVLPDGLRGWASAGYLDFAYQEERVPLATYGAAIGIPILGFALGSYWADNYRDRPWYGDRRWWRGPPPPPAMGWRPPPPPRPGWQPHPWQGPGFAPGPGHRPPGFRPPPPGPGFRPQPGPGFDPGPRPGHGYNPNPGYRPSPGPGYGHGGGHPSGPVQGGGYVPTPRPSGRGGTFVLPGDAPSAGGPAKP